MLVVNFFSSLWSSIRVAFTAFIFDEIDDLLPESFFEVYAAFVFLIETKREVLRTMPGKSTGLHFLFHLLTMY